MLTRSLIFVAGATLALGGGCGATEGNGPDPASTQANSESLVLTGFDSVTGAMMSSLALRLGDQSPITAASLAANPPEREIVEGLTPPVRERDRWLEIWVESSSNEDERLRAYWYGLLAIAGLWDDLRKQKSATDIWGGEVRFVRGETAVREPGLDAFLFGPGAEERAFRDANGHPIRRDVDRGLLEARVRAQAEELGLVIERIAFPGATATAIEIEATTRTPAEFFDKGGLTPFADEVGDLEGYFLNVRDGSGERVAVLGRVSGLQRGFGGYGDAYGERRAAAMDDVFGR